MANTVPSSQPRHELKTKRQPWIGRLTWLGTSCRGRIADSVSPWAAVQSPVEAHIKDNRSMFLSLFLSPFPPSKKNEETESHQALGVLPTGQAMQKQPKAEITKLKRVKFLGWFPFFIVKIIKLAWTFFFKSLFLDRREGRETERERNIDVRNIDQLPLVGALTWDRTCNLHVCPYQASNQQPFLLQSDPQPTEPHWSGEHEYSSWQMAVIVKNIECIPCPDTF